MLISTKGRYALRVLVDMAEHQTDSFVPLKEIAQRQDISEKYLESIVKSLVQGGVLSGLRGKGGGYRLVKQPDQYTVGDILRMTEGPLTPVSCLEPNAPDAVALAGAGQGHQRVSGQHYHRGPHAHGRAGKRLYHLSAASPAAYVDQRQECT